MQQDFTSVVRLNDKSDENLFGKPEKYDYSKFSSLDEFSWDEDLANKFSPIAQKLNLSQESIEMLLEIALEMSRKQKAIYEQESSEKLSKDVFEYEKLFNED